MDLNPEDRGAFGACALSGNSLPFILHDVNSRYIFNTHQNYLPDNSTVSINKQLNCMIKSSKASTDREPEVRFFSEVNQVYFIEFKK